MVDIIADRLRQRPTLRNLSEQRPCQIRQAIDLAVAAAEQIDQNLHRQVFERMLLGLCGDWIGLPVVLNKKVRGHCQPARRGADDMAEIAETVRDKCWRGGADQRACDPRSARQRGEGWTLSVENHGRRLRAVTEIS